MAFSRITLSLGNLFHYTSLHSAKDRTIFCISREFKSSLADLWRCISLSLFFFSDHESQLARTQERSWRRRDEGKRTMCKSNGAFQSLPSRYSCEYINKWWNIIISNWHLNSLRQRETHRVKNIFFYNLLSQSQPNMSLVLHSEDREVWSCIQSHSNFSYLALVPNRERERQSLAGRNLNFKRPAISNAFQKDCSGQCIKPIDFEQPLLWYHDFVFVVHLFAL